MKLLKRLAAILLIAAVLPAPLVAAREPSPDVRARAALALAQAGMEVAPVARQTAAGSIDNAPCSVACNGGSASGTLIQGAPAGTTWVITNRHVAKLGARSVTTSDGTVYPAEIVSISQTYDLAVLSIAADLPCVPVALTNPKKDSSVTLRGNGISSGGFDKRRSGTISFCGSSSLQVDMWGSPGDSGSGFLNSEGQLVGVLWGGPGAAGASTCFGVSASAVRSFLFTLPAAHPNAAKEESLEEPPAGGFFWGAF